MPQVSAAVPNDVDKLLERITILQQEISEIQAHCDHEFVITHKPELEGSKVKGVYLDRTGDDIPGGEFMHIRCGHCSKEESVSIADRCVHCAREMVEFGNLEPREKYFGEKCSNFSARLKRCPNQECGFVVAFDEFVFPLDGWDQ